ncbi:glycoside hydrolase [Mollisia scopiformis]|uniref:Glycoside hydrolase n=1 Tax=Mollisia scopiformis TaxID=149040 RepID=A0A194X0K5_MOLSC|nr:glycoside hydrolase [Mollisia scopiformis]KUJ13725.1 glycoside hydrolase [Mollisia scopiformis]
MKGFLVLALLFQLVASSLHSNFDSYPEVWRKIIINKLAGYHKPFDPVPRLVTYVQTFEDKQGKHVSLLPLLWHDVKVTHVILASVHLHDRPGEIRLNDHSFDWDEYSRTWQEVKALQNHGVKVMAMLGGAAAGTFKHLNGSEEEFYSYYHPLKKLLIEHQLDGLDLNIEESVPLAVPIRLLNALHRDMGPHFILTMSPIASALLSPANTDQNLSGFSYFDLDAFATIPGSETKLISWYNAQFYGNFPRGPPLYEQVMEAGWPAERIVMGVLDSPDDGPPNGFLLMRDLRMRIAALKRKWRDFGGVAGWEYFDGGTGDGVVDKPWDWLLGVGYELFGRDDDHSKKDEL